MSDKKIIAVFGATGAQGGGLVKSILADPSGEFTARALTRNPDSDKAKALAEAGAEVVAADIDDAASIAKALDGAYGAYVVTFFWEHFSPEKEMAQVLSVADAAKTAGLKHVVWSTLEDTRKWLPIDSNTMPTLNEKYNVPHFDGKGESDAYFADAGVPTTNLQTSFYWDNLIHFGMGPQKNEDGSYAFNLPMGDKKLPGMAAADIGKCALGVFKAGDTYIGKTVGVTGEHLTGAEMAAALTDALGEAITYNAVPFDVYRGLGFPGAEDLGNMFQIKHDFNEQFRAARSVDTSRELNPELQSFTAWLQENKSAIPMG
jgi:uncharacterized protein YbjT (DUF2867 family)